MIVLLDTNVLLRLDHVGHPHRQIAREAVERLLDEQHQPRILPQVLYEYWVVATRPAETNGLGFSIEDAEQIRVKILPIDPLYELNYELLTAGWVQPRR